MVEKAIEWHQHRLGLSGEPEEYTYYPLGIAIEYMKLGYAFARRGWNGKNMWIAYSPGQGRLPATQFWAKANREYAGRTGSAPVLPCLTMRTATGEILMGWLASQTDLLADDWFWVKDPS